MQTHAKARQGSLTALLHLHPADKETDRHNQVEFLYCNSHQMRTLNV
jgi:hypothetical protein